LFKNQTVSLGTEKNGGRLLRRPKLTLSCSAEVKEDDDSSDSGVSGNRVKIGVVSSLITINSKHINLTKSNLVQIFEFCTSMSNLIPVNMFSTIFQAK
jgi:hypothetical protein